MSQLGKKAGLKAQLSSSLKEEERLLDSRFERAEQLFDKKVVTEESPKKEVIKPSKKVLQKTFTIPEDEFEIMNTIRQKVAKKGILTNKSEILRAAIAFLNKQDNNTIAEQLEGLVKLTTGRPTRSI